MNGKPPPRKASVNRTSEPPPYCQAGVSEAGAAEGVAAGQGGGTVGAAVKLTEAHRTGQGLRHPGHNGGTAGLTIALSPSDPKGSQHWRLSAGAFPCAELSSSTHRHGYVCPTVSVTAC